MKNQIVEKIIEEFRKIGDNTISGNNAVDIINNVIEDIIPPKEVSDALKYIQDCHNDLGFMGSPEYYNQKKIVDDYNNAINQKRKDDEDLANYLRLKLKFDNKLGYN